MRQLFTLLIALVLTNFSIGQNTESKGTKEISCEITSLNFFQSGANNTLNFTILASGTSGDSLAMTFPVGVTPITGSEIVGQVGDWNEEILNGVDGQVISWGGIFEQSPGYQGGIRPDELYEFWIEVDIDASITDSFEIGFFIDAAGFDTGNFEGTVVVNGVPSAPDLVPNILSVVERCYKMPLNHAVFSPEGQVQNIGEELTEATNFNLTVGTSYDENLPISVPMGTDVIEDFTFPLLTITETGTIDFTYTANAADDAFPENGTIVKSIEITDSVLSIHNGDVIGGTGNGIPGGVSANVFTVTTEDVLTAVSFYLSNCQTGDNTVCARVYEFDGEPGDLIAQTNDVQITSSNTTYTGVFPAQVTLEPGQYLIGIVDGNQFLGLATTSTPYIDHSCWGYSVDSDSWHDQTGGNYANTYAMEAIFGTYQAPDFDVSIEELTLPNYALVGDVDITGIIKNMGGEILTSIDIEYTVNGGSAVSETLSGLSIASLATYDFTLSTPANLTSSEPYEISVHISNGNGLGPDSNPDNDDISTTISTVEYIPTKTVLIEEGTGTWCGWCVRGHVYMDYMAEEFPDSFIGIASHNSDPMTVPAYDSGLAPILQGFPNAYVGRSIIADPLDMEDAYHIEKEVIAPVALTIQNKTYNENTRQLSFTLVAEFVASVSNFRFNAVIVEDEVTGTGSAWNQSNSYSGGTTEMGGYENLPDPVPAEDMVYQDVARDILGGFVGTPSSLPATISAGETHSYEYTTTIDENWDINHIEVVGMVINMNNGKVENACKTELIIGMTELQTSHELSVYPNPATDVVRICALEEMKHLQIFNATGQLVLEQKTSGLDSKINISKYESGYYFIKVYTLNKIIVKKIIIR